MIFSLAIYATPSVQSSDSAYRFANALVAHNHTLYRIFFYHDGVYHGSQLNTPAQDEVDHTVRWQQFAKQHNVDMVICIASGLRRGILNSKEATRYEKSAHNLAEGFELSGLGQLVDAAVYSDRLVTFGH
ncbi:sulfurtransferase TusD [Candidatus Endobugula sertula]|uniref:Sulfurtransferase TusD n=1 Tax=Candidatus Endobugula sertula TaxID=62101 RepID=A0A1D2QSZ5_9GAMM|nr:sulfurtransferase TusD [Candidatus Endobugula sertula]